MTDSSISPAMLSEPSIKVISTIEELRALEGNEFAISPWLLVDQPRIDTFATCTEDQQWIHLDADRAAKESPYGATIAHGFLTLALIPALAQRSYRLKGFRSKLNYGLNKVRFIHPVVSGSRVRARFAARAIQLQEDGRCQLTMQVTIEVEGSDKPACVAESLALLVP